MIAFLTSSPGGTYMENGVEKPCAFNNENGLVNQMAQVWPKRANCLLICAEPTHFQQNTEMGQRLADSLSMSGLTVSRLIVCDDRNAGSLPVLMAKSNAVILSGGHTLTQNRFFKQLDLKRHIRYFDGILLGISGGTMNCAKVVYAQPERPGELSCPDYERFPDGLGLMELMILPHYQLLKGQTLDGMRLIEDVALSDSMGRTFYAIPDGSYVVLRNGGCEMKGIVYMIRDGIITCQDYL